jgi:hypothetical protein
VSSPSDYEVLYACSMRWRRSYCTYSKEMAPSALRETGGWRRETTRCRVTVRGIRTALSRGILVANGAIITSRLSWPTSYYGRSSVRSGLRLARLDLHGQVHPKPRVIPSAAPHFPPLGTCPGAEVSTGHSCLSGPWHGVRRQCGYASTTTNT